MPAFDPRVSAKAAGVLLALLVPLAVLLAVLLPKDFFEEWGWLSGPLAWFLCVWATARILRLPVGPALIGAALAGLPALVAVVLGIHWLGTLLAIVGFALWCGVLRPGGPDPLPR